MADWKSALRGSFKRKRLATKAVWVVLVLIVALFAFSFLPAWTYTRMHSNQPHGRQTDELTGYWLNNDRTSFYPLLHIKPDRRFRAGPYTSGVWHVSGETVNLDPYLVCGTGYPYSLFPAEYGFSLSGDALTLTSESDMRLEGTYQRFDPSTHEFQQDIWDKMEESADTDEVIYAFYVWQTLVREDAWILATDE